MQKIFLTPGPSQTHANLDQYLRQAMELGVCSISHRSAAYKKIHERATLGLRQLVEIPDSHEVLFFASATEIWERLIQNLSAQTSFHFVNGSFSERFFSMGKELQQLGVKQDLPLNEAAIFAPEAIPAHTDLINFTHNESSTGVLQPLEVVYQYADAFPEALITLDVVSSFPYTEIDFSRVDACYFSVQKGMGLPAGLGVLILSRRAVARAKTLQTMGRSIGSYHNFVDMANKAAEFQTPETPNVLGIYLLACVCEAMNAQGIANIRAAMLQKSTMLYETIAEVQGLSPFVQALPFRSPTVIVANTASPSHKWIEALATQHFEIGDGYGIFKGKQIRIANFPTTSVETMAQVCGLLRVGLRD